MFNITQITNESLNVQLQGKNPTNEAESVKLSAIKNEDNGLWYIATVPVGHVAYDEFNDKYRVDTRERARLLKEHTFDYFVSGGMTRYVGDNINQFSTTEVTPLDVSLHQEKMIIVKNTHDQSIFLELLAFRDTQSFTTSNIPFVTDDILGADAISVDAGKTLIISEANYPAINNPFISFVLRVIRNVAPTTGNVNVQFYGR